MTDKLAVSWLGFSLTAEGLWAIGGAIVMVAIVAGVMVLCRPRIQSLGSSASRVTGSSPHSPLRLLISGLLGPRVGRRIDRVGTSYAGTHFARAVE
jgi:hypothetical protein